MHLYFIFVFHAKLIFSGFLSSISQLFTVILEIFVLHCPVFPWNFVLHSSIIEKKNCFGRPDISSESKLTWMKKENLEGYCLAGVLSYVITFGRFREFCWSFSNLNEWVKCSSKILNQSIKHREIKHILLRYTPRLE